MARWAPVALTVLAVVGVGMMPLTGSGSQQDASRIGFVNAEVILRQTPGYAAAESTFNAELASYRQEVDQLQQTLDSAISAFDQQSIVLSPSARQDRTQELRNMQQQFEQRSGELSTLAQRRQQELMAPLEDRIQRVIDGLRAERNLAAIFDIGTPGNNILSADPGLDLTSTVVGRLTGAGQQ